MAVAVEAPAISANNRLPAANRPPEITQKTLSVAQEVKNIGTGPRISPGTDWQKPLLARTASKVSGSAKASSA